MITEFGVDEWSRRLVPDELWTLWMNWAFRGPIDWSRAVDGPTRKYATVTGDIHCGRYRA